MITHNITHTSVEVHSSDKVTDIEPKCTRMVHATRFFGQQPANAAGVKAQTNFGLRRLMTHSTSV